MLHCNIGLIIVTVSLLWLSCLEQSWSFPRVLISQNSNIRPLVYTPYSPIYAQVDSSKEEFSADANSDLGVFRKYDKSLSAERKSFKRFMQVEIWRSGASNEMQALYPLLTSLEKACRDINMLMRRISTDDLDGLTSGETTNIQV